MTDTSIHLLAAILETAAESIIAVNDHHQILVFNKAAQKAFGYAVEEALGQPLDLLLPDRLVNVHREHVHEFAASADRSRPIAHRPELVAKRKDDSEFPVEIGLSKLETDEGIIFTAMIMDITERQRAEEAVEQIRDRFKHKDGTWVWIESTFTNLGSVISVEAIVVNFRETMQRKLSENKIRPQLERLTALREIDQFIISTFDLQMSLNALITGAIKLLSVDAATQDQVRRIILACQANRFSSSKQLLRELEMKPQSWPQRNKGCNGFAFANSNC